MNRRDFLRSAATASALAATHASLAASGSTPRTWIATTEAATWRDLSGALRIADARDADGSENLRLRVIQIDRIRFDAQLATSRKREPLPHDGKQALQLRRRQVRGRPTAEEERIDVIGTPEP